MRKHTAFRVGRTTRCRDFRTALSVITTITDLIPGQWLFVFKLDKRPPGSAGGFRQGCPARAPEPLCVPELIFLGAGEPGRPRAPVLAAQSLPRDDRRSGLVQCRRTGDPGARDDATPCADALVCVGPRAFRPQGAGPFGGARAISSVGERSAHTGEVAGSNPASPTSRSLALSQVRSAVGQTSSYAVGMGSSSCWEEFGRAPLRGVSPPAGCGLAEPAERASSPSSSGTGSAGRPLDRDFGVNGPGRCPDESGGCAASK